MMRFLRKFTSLHSNSYLVVGTLMIFLAGPGVLAQSDKGNTERGQILFEEHCMECHGRTGDGTGAVGYFLAIQPADLLSVESRMKTNTELFTIIKEGILFDEMHGWEGQLSNQDIYDVLSYIRMLAPPLSQGQ